MKLVVSFVPACKLLGAYVDLGDGDGLEIHNPVNDSVDATGTMETVLASTLPKRVTIFNDGAEVLVKAVFDLTYMNSSEIAAALGMLDALKC